MDDFIEGEYTSKHTNTQTNKQQDERTDKWGINNLLPVLHLWKF